MMNATILDGFPGKMPQRAQAREGDVEINTACLGIMDRASVAAVWEDLLFHGDVHGHGGGGLMTYEGAVGTHLDHDGTFPVKVGLDAEGVPVSLSINLDPYGEDLEGLRDAVLAHGYDQHDDDHDEMHDGHAHGRSVDGWSAPVTTTLPTGRVLVGDPAGVEQADGTWGFTEVVFPGPGTLTVSVYQQGRIRRFLVGVFAPASAD